MSVRHTINKTGGKKNSMMNAWYIAVAAAGRTWYMCSLPRRGFPARLAAISASWRVFFSFMPWMHIRACACVCEVHRRGGRQGEGELSPEETARVDGFRVKGFA